MMRTKMSMALALVALAGVLATAVQARAGVPVPTKVTNRSQQPIIVVMDRDRQTEQIVAGGAATFHPNLGDNPTYHVYEVVNGQRGRKLWSESFNTVTIRGFPPRPHVGGDLRWTGSKLERE